MKIPQIPRITEQELGKFKSFLPVLNTLIEFAFKRGYEQCLRDLRDKN